MKHRLSVRLLYPLLWVIFAVIFTVLGPWRAFHPKRIPRKGGVLILANHISDLDPFLVQLASSRLIHFMGKSELFEMKVVGTLMRWFSAFPVRRGEPDRRALKHAVDLLKSGEVVCLFPEGKLSETGALQPVMPGAALIVRQSGCQAICCKIEGTSKIMPYGSLIPRPAFSCAKVRWSEPIAFDKHATNDQILQWIEERLG